MKKETIDVLSNALAHHIQDMFDNLSGGYFFKLEKEKKQIKNIINKFIKAEKNNN